MSKPYNIRAIQPHDRQQLHTLIAQLESYPAAVERVLGKAWQCMIACSNVPAHTALIFKQELLALNGDALIAPEVYLGQTDAATPVLAWASERAWNMLCQKIANIPIPALQLLAQEIQATLALHPKASLQVGNRTWSWGERTLIMGIINTTPDSFSNDGLLSASPATQLDAQIQAFTSAGADILDIGGESTRPGAKPVSVTEEIQRVLPAIKAARQLSDVPISIDTYKAEVASAALSTGANMINDIWGLRTPTGGWNVDLAQLTAQHNVPIILMHNRRATAQQTQLGGHFTGVEYSDLIADICADLQQSIDFAIEHGIKAQHIILDPGFGFGKTPSQNIALFQQLSQLRSLGYPVLVGTSRKSFIGLALQAPVDQRTYGTAATVTYAIQQGADIVRVHDVAAMAQVCRMSDALIRPGVWQKLHVH